MFLSVMIRVLSYDYVHEKRAAVCISQPSKQGFPMSSLVLAVRLLIVSAYRAVSSGQPNENFTDDLQHSQRVSPKWFHNDLLFNCSLAKVVAND